MATTAPPGRTLAPRSASMDVNKSVRYSAVELETATELLRYKCLCAALAGVMLFSTLFSFFTPETKSTSDVPSCEGSSLSEDGEDDKNGHTHIGNIFFIVALTLYVTHYMTKLGYSFVRSEYETWLLTTQTQTFDRVEYLFYRIDYLYSHHDKFVLMMLAVFTVCLILSGGILWWVFTDSSLVESIWASWTFVADPGTHAEQRGLVSRIISITLSMGGMIIFAIVIGMIHQNITLFMENLRSGKSRVILSNHSLILGEGDKLIPIISELAMANESEGGGTIVILSQKDKEELEELLDHSGINLYGSDIVVRTGVPYFSSDLHKVSAHTARSIIILLDYSQSPDIIDVLTVRTLLCLKGMNLKNKIRGHIVADVFDIDNEELVQVVGKGLNVDTFVSTDIIGRLMIQCAREKGLSQVLESLLGFDGCEFYMKTWEELNGLTFGEIMYRFEGAVPIGILRKEEVVEEDDDGKGNIIAPPGQQQLFKRQPSVTVQNNRVVSTRMLLNPDVDTILEPGDSVVVISEDDDTYYASPTCLFYKEHVSIADSDVDTQKISKLNSPSSTTTTPPSPPTPPTATHLSASPTNTKTPPTTPADVGDGVSGFSGGRASGKGRRGSVSYNTLKSQLCGSIGSPYQPRKKFKEKLLFIGMRRDMGDMITALDAYLCPGSQLTLFNHVPLEQREARLRQGYRTVETVNVSIEHVCGNQTIRKDLESLGLEQYDSILILADEDTAAVGGGSFDMTHADSKSLTSLILIRDIQKQLRMQFASRGPDDEVAVKFLQKISKCALISEILDVRTKPLISIDADKTTDYISSNSMLSMAIAMVSEQREVNQILKELLTAEGNELYLVPMLCYLKATAVASFNEVSAMCKLGPNHLLIGYKLHGEIYLNPPNKTEPIHWSEDEAAELIVMASDLE